MNYLKIYNSIMDSVGKKMSSETKNKIRKSNTGKIRSDESKDKNRQKMIEYWKNKKIVP